jgi:TfoX/Sxy family transcriptional regulator of competence genes
MACSSEFIDFICSQLSGAGVIRSRKMFGDWCIYVDEKPIVLACDDIAFVKKNPAIAHLMVDAECGIPYDGAKEHYILDIEHREAAVSIVKALLAVTPYPKKKA